MSALLLVSVAATAFLAQAPKSLTLESPILKEDRRILVRLPRDYETNTAARYPVLYKLDGDNDLERYHNTIDVLSSADLMPDLIVVAIPNGRNKRNRDLTPPTLHQDEEKAEGDLGEGGKFLEFIEKELIPNIDKTYRTLPGQRMLAGHSRGGLLVLYSLIAKPDLFQARFLFSGPLMRENKGLIVDTHAFLKKNRNLKSFLYCNWGSAENEGMGQSYDEMRRLLSKEAPKGLRWIVERAKGADHQHTQGIALPSALIEYFAIGSSKSPPVNRLGRAASK